MRSSDTAEGLHSRQDRAPACREGQRGRDSAADGSRGRTVGFKTIESAVMIESSEGKSRFASEDFPEAEERYKVAIRLLETTADEMDAKEQGWGGDRQYSAGSQHQSSEI